MDRLSCSPNRGRSTPGRKKGIPARTGNLLPGRLPGAQEPRRKAVPERIPAQAAPVRPVWKNPAAPAGSRSGIDPLRRSSARTGTPRGCRGMRPPPKNRSRGAAVPSRNRSARRTPRTSLAAAAGGSPGRGMPRKDAVPPHPRRQARVSDVRFPARRRRCADKGRTPAVDPFRHRPPPWPPLRGAPLAAYHGPPRRQLGYL